LQLSKTHRPGLGGGAQQWGKHRLDLAGGHRRSPLDPHLADQQRGVGVAGCGAGFFLLNQRFWFTSLHIGGPLLLLLLNLQLLLQARTGDHRDLLGDRSPALSKDQCANQATGTSCHSPSPRLAFDAIMH
jgi:hypothetical protein